MPLLTPRQEKCYKSGDFVSFWGNSEKRISSTFQSQMKAQDML